MNTDLKYRKEILIRKNRCKELHQKYLKKIGSLLSIDVTEIKFLSLEESDYIRKKEISNKIYTNRYDTFNKNDLDNLNQELKDTKGSYYIFIDHDWEYCGCFQISNLDIIDENFAFGTYITDDILFIKDTFLSKITLDYYEMDNQFFIDYEVYNNS